MFSEQLELLFFENYDMITVLVTAALLTIVENEDNAAKLDEMLGLEPGIISALKDVFADIAIVGIGVVYIVFRCFGKYFGTLISAKATKCDPNIIKYLGITLFPQAFVALGMAIKAETLGEPGIMVANITLFSVLVYELVGPFLTKIALQKAGEITPEGKTSARGNNA